MKSQPMPGYIIVKPVIEEIKSKTIIMVETKPKVTPTRGEVMAISGPLQHGGRTIECPVKVGDHVIYRPFSQANIEEDGVKYFLIYFLDLFATYEQD